MTIHHTNAKERGAAHLVLVLAFVVVLIGVLGFLGYNAWQKQNADAGGVATAGRIDAAKITCSATFNAPNDQGRITGKIKFTNVSSKKKGGIRGYIYSMVNNPPQPSPVPQVTVSDSDFSLGAKKSKTISWSISKPQSDYIREHDRRLIAKAIWWAGGDQHESTCSGTRSY